MKPYKHFARAATRLVHNRSLRFLRVDASAFAGYDWFFRPSHPSRTVAGSQRTWAGCDCPDRSLIASIKPPGLIPDRVIRQIKLKTGDLHPANQTAFDTPKCNCCDNPWGHRPAGGESGGRAMVIVEETRTKQIAVSKR